MAAVNVEDWYKNVPVITRAYMTGCILTTVAVQFEWVTPLVLYLNWNLVFQSQFWRLLTNFFFFDYFGLNFLFHMFFFLRHSRLLEEGSFRGRTGDFLYMWLFGAVFLLVIDFIFAPKVMFLAPSLAFMVVYVWSRRSENVRMSFLGFFTFTAPHLPWVILGFGVLLGQSPVYDLLGICVGHLYYFLEDVYPKIRNRRLLKTPSLLKHIFDAPEGPVPQPGIAM
jgi:Derlin-2/3